MSQAIKNNAKIQFSILQLEGILVSTHMSFHR